MFKGFSMLTRLFFVLCAIVTTLTALDALEGGGNTDNWLTQDLSENHESLRQQFSTLKNGQWGLKGFLPHQLTPNTQWQTVMAKRLISPSMSFEERQGILDILQQFNTKRRVAAYKILEPVMPLSLHPIQRLQLALAYAKLWWKKSKYKIIQDAQSNEQEIDSGLAALENMPHFIKRSLKEFEDLKNTDYTTCFAGLTDRQHLKLLMQELSMAYRFNADIIKHAAQSIRSHMGVYERLYIVQSIAGGRRDISEVLPPLSHQEMYSFDGRPYLQQTTGSRHNRTHAGGIGTSASSSGFLFGVSDGSQGYYNMYMAFRYSDYGLGYFVGQNMKNSNYSLDWNQGIKQIQQTLSSATQEVINSTPGVFNSVQEFFVQNFESFQHSAQNITSGLSAAITQQNAMDVLRQSQELAQSGFGEIIEMATNAIVDNIISGTTEITNQAGGAISHTIGNVDFNSVTETVNQAGNVITQTIGDVDLNSVANGAAIAANAIVEVARDIDWGAILKALNEGFDFVMQFLPR